MSLKLGRAFGRSVLLLVLLALGAGEVRAQTEGVALDVPRVVLGGVPFTVTVKDPAGELAEGATLVLRVGERTYEATSAGAETAIAGVSAAADETLALVDAAGTTLATAAVAPIPGWFAILPALIAIVVALTLRQVIAALFLGIWLGAALVYVRSRASGSGCSTSSPTMSETRSPTAAMARSSCSR
jgi:hypothetical protein